MQWQDGLVYGSVAKEFTLHEVSMATQAMVRHWLPSTEANVIIGYDTRYQSDMAAKVASEVVAAHGITTILSKEPVPWGAVLNAQERRNGGGAIYITGGARAVEYNGIRFMSCLETVLSQNEWERWWKEEQGGDIAKKDFQIAVSSGLIEPVSLMDEYLLFLADTIHVDKIKHSQLRVFVDALYGGGQGVITRLCKTEQGNIEEIHQTRHSMFGGLVPQPEGASINELAQRLALHQKHLGIAWDAEGRSWSWINAYSKNCIPGQKMFKLITQYIIDQQKRRVDNQMLSQDGILQSLIFLEMLVDNN